MGLDRVGEAFEHKDGMQKAVERSSSPWVACLLPSGTSWLLASLWPL